MKKLILLPTVFVAVLACQEPTSVSEFTGNEKTYELAAGSAYAINGTITFKERTDCYTTVQINLNGTDGNEKHPVHLHLGSIATPGADVAALLSPVEAKTGKSETLLKQLADETIVRYSDLSKLEACIKVHLSDTGAGRDIVLAGGNIGASYAKALANGREAIAPCKSE
ncbi:MAG: hypothetical protein ACOYW3_15810 [Bacteroidota bacterium]